MVMNVSVSSQLHAVPTNPNFFTNMKFSSKLVIAPNAVMRKKYLIHFQVDHCLHAKQVAYADHHWNECQYPENQNGWFELRSIH